ncbi:MAG: PhzF family phenazine biosynthesis protein [Thermodesulfobacteriota bacterium]
MPDSSAPWSGAEYLHLDVFTRRPLSGNGLTVFLDCAGWPGEAMQALTREMRQFESIFLAGTGEPDTVRARIFTMEEELPFAGHPVLGAAAALHLRAGSDGERAWRFALDAGTVTVRTSCPGPWCEAAMDQGRASFGPPLDAAAAEPFAAAMGLAPGDLHPDFPLQVASTGLPYLLLPVRGGLDRTGVRIPGFEALLAGIGAKFAYVLDVAAREGRTWDNLGLVEDVATGSAAGPAGAYLVRHGAARAGEEMVLSQGRFLGRPSDMRITVREGAAGELSATVAGDVVLVGAGRLA